MRIEVLGCSGGIGDGRHTTAFLVDDDILLDAGTGVARLSSQALARIDHVFLTHSHLDHILSLPLLLDSVAGETGRAGGGARHSLRCWKSSRITCSTGASGRISRAFLRRRHPSCAFPPSRSGSRSASASGSSPPSRPATRCRPRAILLRGGEGSLIFSGDTESHGALWDLAEMTADLRHLLVECAFSDEQQEIAQASRHYHPASLAADLAGLRPGPSVWITHLKPGGEAAILDQLATATPHPFQALREGQLLGI
jgi:ribonuclease BN (tRNA processing enzyme)